MDRSASLDNTVFQAADSTACFLLTYYTIWLWFCTCSLTLRTGDLLTLSNDPTRAASYCYWMMYNCILFLVCLFKTCLEHERLVEYRIESLPVDLRLVLLLLVREDEDFDVRIRRAGHVHPGKVRRLDHAHRQLQHDDNLGACKLDQASDIEVTQPFFKNDYCHSEHTVRLNYTDVQLTIQIEINSWHILYVVHKILLRWRKTSTQWGLWQMDVKNILFAILNWFKHRPTSDRYSLYRSDVGLSYTGWTTSHFNITLRPGKPAIDAAWEA